MDGGTMEISMVEDGEVSILALKGSLNLNVAAEVRTHIGDILEKGSVKLVCDLTEVDYMDSAGLGVLIYGLKESIATGGKFAVCGMDSRIDEVFKLARLDQIIQCYQHRELATKALQG
jgi:anti-anti-sigma factor